MLLSLFVSISLYPRIDRFVLVAIELAFSFAMGVSCLIFSVNLVRKLREEDQPPYHRVSYGVGGGRGGSGGYHGPAAGVVRDKTEESGAHDEEQQRGEEEGNQRSAAVRRRRTGRLGPGRPASVSATTSAADFARRRGIGSLLSRNAGSRLDVYYDDSDDEYVHTADAGDERGCDAGVLHAACDSAAVHVSGRLFFWLHRQRRCPM